MATGKLTIKQERFAQLFVRTGNAADAYLQAYACQRGTKRTTLRAEGHKLIQHPEIARRIEQLRERVRKSHDLTVQDILNELDENRELAVREGQASAATQATMGKAKVSGFLVERIQAEITFRGVAERMRQRAR